MPFPSFEKLSELLPQQVLNWARQVAAQVQGWLSIEHHDDGTHSDIHADSITVTGTDTATFAGPINAAHWLNLDPVLAAFTGQGRLSGEPGWTGPRILLGITGDISTSDFAKSLGLRLRGDKTTASGDDDWAILVGQDGNSAATALGVMFMDAVGTDDRVPLIVRYHGGTFDVLPGKVTEGTAGVNLGSAAGGYTSGYVPFTEIHGRTITAGSPDGEVIIGSPTTDGVKLSVVLGVLSVEEGDGSAAAGVNALYFFGTHLGGDGSVGSPSFTFQPDQDTGFFRAGSGEVWVSSNGVAAASVRGTATAGWHAFDVYEGAFGTGNVGGAQIKIGRNTSGSGAAGVLGLERVSGGFFYLWADNTGVLRLNNAFPHEDGSPSDTASGVAVGDQTSSIAAKHIIRERFDYDVSLEAVLEAAVFDFTYKDGRYNNETFTGITTEQAPLFGKDHGKALNEVSSIGHLIQAIKAQQQHIERLESELIALKMRVE